MLKNFQVIEFARGLYWTCEALVFIPTSGNTLPNGRYPVVLFLHGRNLGTSTDAVAGEGLPYIIESQGSVWGTSLSGKRVDYAVIAPIRSTWTPIPEWIPYIFEGGNVYGKEYPGFLKMFADKIDLNNIGVTGLSAGGQESINCITDARTSKYFSCGVHFAAAGAAPDYSQYAINKQKSWLLTGDQDTTAPLSTARDIVAGINNSAPGSAFLTTLPGYGHGGWNTMYDPVAGRYPIGSNVMTCYDFMLAYPKVGSVPNPGPTPVPTPTPAPAPTLLVRVETKKGTLSVFDDASTKLN